MDISPLLSAAGFVILFIGIGLIICVAGRKREPRNPGRYRQQQPRHILG